MAEWIIGDVHGHLRALEKLLDGIDRRYGPPERLVFVGDLVDRGPDSRGVMELVRSLSGTAGSVVLLGNHDELMLQNILLQRDDLAREARVSEDCRHALTAGLEAEPQRVLRLWMMNGGYTTIRSYGGDPWMPSTWNIPASHLAFLATRPLAWSNGTCYASHARAGLCALRSGLQLSETPWRVPEDDRHSLLWSRARPQDQPDLPHYSGHTPQDEVAHEGNQILIDTGCAYRERLTAVAPGDDLVFQCDCHG